MALQQMKGPSRLMRSTLRHSSRSVSHTVLLMPAIPALLTRMSILPSAVRDASRAFSTAARSDTSTLIALLVRRADARLLVLRPMRFVGAGGDKPLGDGA